MLNIEIDEMICFVRNEAEIWHLALKKKFIRLPSEISSDYAVPRRWVPSIEFFLYVSRHILNEFFYLTVVLLCLRTEKLSFKLKNFEMSLKISFIRNEIWHFDCISLTEILHRHIISLRRIFEVYDECFTILLLIIKVNWP